MIYNGDCREILPSLGWPRPYSALLTDPPYGISYDASHSKYLNGIDRGEALWEAERIARGLRLERDELKARYDYLMNLQIENIMLTPHQPLIIKREGKP